jgi:hypothetical protein
MALSKLEIQRAYRKRRRAELRAGRAAQAEVVMLR